MFKEIAKALNAEVLPAVTSASRTSAAAGNKTSKKTLSKAADGDKVDNATGLEALYADDNDSMKFAYSEHE